MERPPLPPRKGKPKKRLQIGFDVISRAPESYVGFIDDKGNKLGDWPLWTSSIVLTPEWDAVVAEAYKIDLERSWVSFPLLERGLGTAYSREKEKASRQKKVVKNQYTGQQGWWITTREGKRIFVSSEKVHQQNETKLKEYTSGALKTLAVALTAAVGVHGAYFAMNSARMSYFYKDIMPLKRGVKLIWDNKKAVADQITLPFTSTKRSGMGVIPLSINPIEAPTGLGGDMVLFNYGLVSKKFKSLGTAAYGINMKEKYIYPVIYFKNQKGQHPQALKALFQDSYERAQKLGLKQFRINTVEDGGYAWARTGFEFMDPLQREKIVKSGHNWLKDPTITATPAEAAATKVAEKLKGGEKVPTKAEVKAPVKGMKDTMKEAIESLGPYSNREGMPGGPPVKKKIDLTPGQKAEIESMIANARTAKDFAELTYRHPTAGKIRLGKEFMLNTHWNGYVDISTDNPGHRIMKKWLYGKGGN